MKVFITGHKGYIGSELVKRGFLPLECDITDPADVQRAIKYAKPQLVIHLAGKSSVNWCEDKANQEEVILNNIRGTRNVFEGLSQRRIPGVFISTDQIWRGGLFEQHKENSKITERTLPVNFYAITKMAAESAVEDFGGRIIRTSFLFDAKRLEKHLPRIEKRDYPVFIRRSFMYLKDFCDALEMYCDRYYKMPKVLHISGSEKVSWYGFMKEIGRQYGFSGLPIKPRLHEVPSGAPRPWFGGLDTRLARSLGFPPRSYIDGIKRMKNGS
jgi:dTDP-4-dehydrorhamnose reductase